MAGRRKKKTEPLLVPTPPDERTVHEQRVDEIVTVMAAGQWARGASHAYYAQKWNLSVSRVEDIASEASRVIKRIVRVDEDRAVILSGAIAKIESLVAMAKTRTRTRFRRVRNGKTWEVREFQEPDPDINAALKGIALHLQALGLLRHQIDVIPQASPLAGLSDQDLERMLAEEDRVH